MDEFMELLDKIAPIIYVVVPAIAAIWWKLRDKLKEKEKEVKASNSRKAKETYDIWEHEESKLVISKIKGFCNLFKDKEAVDLVQYVQLENGTTATSKLQNMFLTCLAEDNRFGRVPKLINNMQRMPYSECSAWIEKLPQASTGEQVVAFGDFQSLDFNSIVFEHSKGTVGSIMLAPVFDPNEVLLGVCVFYYAGKDFNGMSYEAEVASMLRFKNAVENVLFVYHQNRIDKKKQLGIDENE